MLRSLLEDGGKRKLAARSLRRSAPYNPAVAGGSRRRLVSSEESPTLPARPAYRYACGSVFEGSQSSTRRCAIPCATAWRTRSQVGAGETYFSAFALFLRATAPQVALDQHAAAAARVVRADLLRLDRQLRRPPAARALGLRAASVAVAADPAGARALQRLRRSRRCSSCSCCITARTTCPHRSGRASCATSCRSAGAAAISPIARGSRRSRRSAASSLCGLLLHELDTAGRTYFGFVLIFLIAFVARTISVYHLTFLHEPPPTTTAPDMHIEHWWRSLLSTGAIGFSVYVALMNAAVGISSPFFTVYMLRDLELSYLEFTVLAGTSVLVPVPDADDLGPHRRRLRQSLDPDRDEHLAADRAVAVALVRQLLDVAAVPSFVGLELVGIHAVRRQLAVRARAANAPRSLRRVPQRRDGGGRVRGRDARRAARASVAAARRLVRRIDDV